MKYIVLLAFAAAALIISPEVLAQANPEDEIVRITERILGVVVEFFGALLDEFGRFLREFVPFFGGSE